MKQLVHTSQPHERALVVSVIKKGGNRIEALEYLDELAFLAETAGAEVISKIYQERVRPDRATMIGKGKVAEIKSYGAQDEANLDFVSGRVDLIAADSFVLYDFIASKDGDFAEATGPDFDDPKYLGEGIGVGIRKGDDDLKARLNAAIQAIRANGTYQKINEKYFSFDVYGAE